jgi:hypothetical protein
MDLVPRGGETFVIYADAPKEAITELWGAARGGRNQQSPAAGQGFR